MVKETNNPKTPNNSAVAKVDRRSKASGRRRLWRPILGLVIFLAGVATLFMGLKKLSPPAPAADLTADKPLVVASVPHIAIWTKQLVGPQVEVKSLVTGGVDVHDFSFKPADLALVAGADLVVANGAELEPWLNNLEQKFKDKTFVRSAAGLSLRPGDPHVWLDPVLAQQQVKNIAGALKEIFPKRATEIDVNELAFTEQLRRLDRDIKGALAALPAGQKNFIAFHDAFNYFAARYGLKQAAQLVERPGDQLTAQEIKNVGETARRLGLTTLFIEPGPVPDLADSLAKQFGLRLIVLDPLEVVPPEAGEYLAGMRRNLRALVDGLSATGTGLSQTDAGLSQAGPTVTTGSIGHMPAP